MNLVDFLPPPFVASSVVAFLGLGLGIKPQLILSLSVRSLRRPGVLAFAWLRWVFVEANGGFVLIVPHLLLLNVLMSFTSLQLGLPMRHLFLEIVKLLVVFIRIFPGKSLADSGFGGHASSAFFLVALLHVFRKVFFPNARY